MERIAFSFCIQKWEELRSINSHFLQYCAVKDLKPCLRLILKSAIINHWCYHGHWCYHVERGSSCIQLKYFSSPIICRAAQFIHFTYNTILLIYGHFILHYNPCCNLPWPSAFPLLSHNILIFLFLLIIAYLLQTVPFIIIRGKDL